MSPLIRIDRLVKIAKKEGVGFGRGDPYNRLRYYTKIGWLPHMTRKKVPSGDVIGHYPKWVLDRLILIDGLKKQGHTNDYITSKINTRNKLHNLYAKVTTQEFKNKIITYIAVAVLIVVLLNELDFVNISKSKNQALLNYTESTPNQIIDSGVSFVPAGKITIFVKNSRVHSGSKVYITFNQNFSPASRFWVSNVEAQRGFSVELDAPVFDNVEFSWWISE